MGGAMLAGYGGPAGPGFALLAGTVAATLLALIVLVVALAHRSRPAMAPVAEHPAIGVLKERLARGEIDTEEFERRLFALLTHDSPR